MQETTPANRCDRDLTRTRWISDGRERQLDTDLAALPELLALVEITITGLHRPGDSGGRSTPGSRPPLSVAAVALTDRRTRQTDPDVIGASALDAIAGRRDGIAPTIHAWVLLAEGEMLDADVPHTDTPEVQGIGADCAWLARHIVWIREQQWVEEFASAVRRMVRDCEQHLHIRPEYRPHCTTTGCRTALDAHQGWWSCPACGRDYRDARMTLAVQQPMTVAALAQAFPGLSRKTIESWVQREHLRPVSDTRPARYEVIDVMRLADASGLEIS